MITVAGDFHSASSLLLPHRVEADDINDDFANYYYFVLKREGQIVIKGIDE